MRLSDYGQYFDSVVRDGSFQQLNKINKRMSPNSLVYITQVMDIPINVSCIITTPEIFALISFSGGVALSKNPKKSFFEIHKIYIDTLTQKIGHNTVITDSVFISDGVTIGHNCTIGGTGFEIFEGEEIPHHGCVIIKEGAIIQNNVCVDKGLAPDTPTIIGKKVAIDNLVHIAHGVQIGEYTKIAAGSKISGNVTIGKNVWIGPDVTISNNITIGDNACVGIGSLILHDIPDNIKVFGRPAKVVPQ